MLLLLAVVGAAAPSGRAGETGPACGAPPELLDTAGAPLPATAEAVGQGSIRVLLVGSASVFGPGTSGPEAAWPVQTEAKLKSHFPGLTVQMAVRGGRGILTSESARLIAAELASFRPHLVLWQTGTVEAVRGLEMDLVTSTLNEAVEQVLAAGVDLVLIDQQFSRFLRANANIDAYRDAIRLVAAAHGLPVLRRYDLMHFWADNDVVDLERAPRDQRVAAADRLNGCLGAATAALIRSGVGEARGQTPAREAREKASARP
jgi:hypothetical protein